MPQSLANILIHITFSTKNRHPFLAPDIQPEVNSYIAAVARAADCPAVRVESVQDHVHMVVALSRVVALSDLIKEIKTSSSRWIKGKGESFSDFQWQRGYGAFSVSQSALQSVLDYLAGQHEHHKVVGFQDEFRRFLEKHGIQFDERYVWD